MKKLKKSTLAAFSIAIVLAACTGATPVEVPMPTYSIRLSMSGSGDFGTMQPGDQPEARTVTVTNTGNQATGALSVALSRGSLSPFALSAVSIPSIGVDGSAEFTVVPKSSGVGPSIEMITVTGGNNIAANLAVMVTVDSSVYRISLQDSTAKNLIAPGSAYAFPTLNYSYTVPPELSVIVQNTGNQALTDLTAEITAGGESYTLTGGDIGGLLPGAYAAPFSVRPKTGLGEGTHTATVQVSGSSIAAVSFTVNFTVGIYTISLDIAPHGDFGQIQPGVPSSPRTVTVTNMGRQPTGLLTAALSGDNPNSFILSKITIENLAVGLTDTFTVTPKTSLNAGDYRATVIVFGSYGITAELGVSFTMPPVYTVSLAIDGGGDFGVTTAPRTVTVTNTGNQPAGALTIALSGTNPGSFTLSKTAISNLAPNGTDTFTIAPKTGIASGSHTATITVSGSNNITAGANVSVTVNALTPAATPIADPPGGSYYEGQEVALITATAGAIIYYTLDGAAPTSANERYAHEISLPTGVTTIKAIAVKDGMSDSAVMSETYTIEE
ncbi:MAG: choice-of-anchor D domain-containing protein [Treponema sp.]|jgi:hypothetical protein|nr:choice-of-anchor D domain-containing protein [Treponema sp.]